MGPEPALTTLTLNHGRMEGSLRLMYLSNLREKGGLYALHIPPNIHQGGIPRVVRRVYTREAYPGWLGGIYTPGKHTQGVQRWYIHQGGIPRVYNCLYTPGRHTQGGRVPQGGVYQGGRVYLRVYRGVYPGWYASLCT